jgi:hypothetical protein
VRIDSGDGFPPTSQWRANRRSVARKFCRNTAEVGSHDIVKWRRLNAGKTAGAAKWSLAGPFTRVILTGHRQSRLGCGEALSGIRGAACEWGGQRVHGFEGQRR